MKSLLNYISAHKFQFELKLHNLGEADNAAWQDRIAKWIEDKWGYIRGFKGLEYRKEAVSKLKDFFYIVTYADQPIAMFALVDATKELEGKRPIKAKELMFSMLMKIFAV